MNQPIFGPDGFVVPDWPAPANVRAVCSTRLGGVSQPPWNSLNLGDHVGDAAGDVATNRDRFSRRLGARPVFLRQVHGFHTVELAAGTPDGTEADACTTGVRGLACTIMVADCLPILLSDREGHRVAAAHAGWRGLAGQGGRGIVESVMAGFDPARTLAWLGPCIGPAAFEVGPEVKAAFEAHDPGCHELFIPRAHDRWLADLPGLARRRLATLGVRELHGNDGSAAWCTVSNRSVFFSHRRDRTSGRLAAAVWRD